MLTGMAASVAHIASGAPSRARMTLDVMAFFRLTEVCSDPVQSARDAIAIAEPLARRRVEAARVSSVVMHVDTESQSIASIDIGVHAYRRGLFGATRLWSGFVSIDNGRRQAEFREGGEYGAEQLAQLSALPGSGFPPEPLDIDSLAVDAPDLLRVAAERLASKGASTSFIELRLWR
jgi:hypothetical protein